MSTNTLPVGFELFWYKIQRILGQGGFGTTYLAHDKNLKKDVAIKEYLPREVAMRNHEDMTLKAMTEDKQDVYQWGLERFRAEAQILAQFQHRNIVRVMSVFDHNNTAYMIMEFEQGQDLSKMLKTGCTFSEKELMDLTTPILDGLQFLHQRGFVHRDVKPANILLRADGSPVLIDFGSARQFVNEETRTLTSLLSNGYAPIEQYNVDTKKQGPWTDIYGLGATLYRLVSAQKPVDAITRGLACSQGDPDPLIPLREISSGFSDTFLNAIESALRVRPEDRPQSIVEWRNMLEGKPSQPVEEELDGDPTIVSHQPEATKKSLQSLNQPESASNLARENKATDSTPPKLLEADSPHDEDEFDESLMVDITDRLGRGEGHNGHGDEKNNEHPESGVGRALGAGLLLAILGGGGFYAYQNNLLPTAITDAITNIASTPSPNSAPQSANKSIPQKPAERPELAVQHQAPTSNAAAESLDAPATSTLSPDNSSDRQLATSPSVSASEAVISNETMSQAKPPAAEAGVSVATLPVKEVSATAELMQTQSSPLEGDSASAPPTKESRDTLIKQEASAKPSEPDVLPERPANNVATTAATIAVTNTSTSAQSQLAELDSTEENTLGNVSLPDTVGAASASAIGTSVTSNVADSLAKVPVAEPEIEIEAPPSEEEIQAAMVAELVSLGRQYLAEDALTLPADANALDTFRKVISIEPDNSAALSGLSAIASRYSSLAAKPIAEGDWSKALGLLERGQKAQSDHAEIKQQLRQIQKHQNTFAQLEQLINEGQQRLLSGHLISPPGQSAWDSYRSALHIEIDHKVQEPLRKQAEVELASIELNLAEKVEQMIVVQDLAMAKLVLEGAKEKFPESAKLAAQEQALQDAIEAQLPRVSTLIISHQELTNIDSPQLSPLPVDRSIHIGFNYQNFQQQTSVIKAILYDGARSLELAQVPVVVTGKEGVKFIRMDRPVEGFAEGGYNVDLLLGEDRLKSVSFYVKRSSAP